MASTLEQVKRLLKDDEVKHQLFKALEQEMLSEEAAHQLYPELVITWKEIGAAMSCPWQWVMVLDLSLAAFLAPTAMLLPFDTLKVFPAVWWFLLHPGSTNTSAIIKLYQDVLDILEQEILAERYRLRGEWTEQHPGGAQHQESV